MKIDNYINDKGGLDTNKLIEDVGSAPLPVLHSYTDKWTGAVRDAAVFLIGRLDECWSMIPLTKEEAFTYVYDCETILLCGAESWNQYARGGCYLVGDQAIAEYLLTDEQLRWVDDEWYLTTYDDRVHVITLLGEVLQDSADLLMSLICENAQKEAEDWYHNDYLKGYGYDKQ